MTYSVDGDSGKGSSINGVKVLGGGDQAFFYSSTKPSVIKSVTMGGGGVKKYQILLDDP